METLLENASVTSLQAQLRDLLSEPIDTAKERARIAFDSEVRPFNNRFVLFGAGNTGRRILARMRQDGIEPLAFSDNQSANWGKTIDGLEVLPRPMQSPVTERMPH